MEGRSRLYFGGRGEVEVAFSPVRPHCASSAAWDAKKEPWRDWLSIDVNLRSATGGLNADYNFSVGYGAKSEECGQDCNPERGSRADDG